jgi:hypothetical protein
MQSLKVNCYTGWKLHNFPTLAKKKRIDTFQLKGLRRILGFKHTNWDRTATNQKIFETATIEAYRKGSKKAIAKNVNKQMCSSAKPIRNKKRNLLGHILRTNNEDPLRQVSLQPNSGKPLEKVKRRAGKPRQRWIDNVMKKVWKKFRSQAPKVMASNPNKKRKFKQSTRQCKYIKSWAEERKF